jgi:hypothetical protein
VSLRIQRLASLDPRAAPLPHGTEVTTGVDRVHDGRVVAQGAVGRVVRIEGDTIDVAIVGVGTLRFAREEVTPRKVGQVQFAARRAASWDALRACTVIETRVGSHAWGLADETSDVDVRGVFALPLPWSLGLVSPPDDLVSADGSATLWVVDKAVRSALRADPNVLETLFVPGVLALDPIGEWLLEVRDAFVSTEIYGSFGRYALSQLKRLGQSARLAEHRTDVLDWLRSEPNVTLDEIASRLARISPRAAPTESDAIHQAKQYVKQLYRSLFDQGLLDANDFASLVVFARDRSASLDLPREMRPKNAYNLLRLLHTATAWLRTGAPEFAMHGALRERLLAIKRGEVALDDVLAEAEAFAPELESARGESKLPTRPDIARADAALRRIGIELARRWTSQEAGPFGADAPAAPVAEWQT